MTHTPKTNTTHTQTHAHTHNRPFSLFAYLKKVARALTIGGSRSARCDSRHPYFPSGSRGWLRGLHIFGRQCLGTVCVCVCVSFCLWRKGWLISRTNATFYACLLCFTHPTFIDVVEDVQLLHKAPHIPLNLVFFCVRVLHEHSKEPTEEKLRGSLASGKETCHTHTRTKR